MAERVGIGARLRIFVMSVGFVSVAAGGGLFYLTFIANGTSARIDKVTKDVGAHDQKLTAHDGTLDTHGKRLDAHDGTLATHGTRLDGAEQGVAEAKEAAKAADQKATDAGQKADALAGVTDGLKKDGAAAQATIAELREELDALRKKVAAGETERAEQVSDILRRLDALEAGRRARP